MNVCRLQALVAETNELILADENFRRGSFITETQRATGWLGGPAATEAEIERLEQRLLRKLPLSYRNFLTIANGFGPINSFIYDLCSTDEVDWLANSEPELVEMWEEGADAIPDDPELTDQRYLLYDGTQIEGALRPGHMRQCLMISHWGDAGFLTLNPAVQHGGEWEAWHFANWMPSAQRYRSFAELLEDNLRLYKEIRREQK